MNNQLSASTLQYVQFGVYQQIRQVCTPQILQLHEAAGDAREPRSWPYGFHNAIANLLPSCTSMRLVTGGVLLQSFPPLFKGKLIDFPLMLRCFNFL